MYPFGWVAFAFAALTGCCWQRLRRPPAALIKSGGGGSTQPFPKALRTRRDSSWDWKLQYGPRLSPTSFVLSRQNTGTGGKPERHLTGGALIENVAAGRHFAAWLAPGGCDGSEGQPRLNCACSCATPPAPHTNRAHWARGGSAGRQHGRRGRCATFVAAAPQHRRDDRRMISGRCHGEYTGGSPRSPCGKQPTATATAPTGAAGATHRRRRHCRTSTRRRICQEASGAPCSGSEGLKRHPGAIHGAGVEGMERMARAPGGRERDCVASH